MNPVIIYLLCCMYIIGVGISVGNRTIVKSKTHFYEPCGVFDDGITIINYRRIARPGDIWYAMWWPLRFIWKLSIDIIGLLNFIMGYLFLLVGFKYNTTKLYRNIKDYMYRKGL